MSSVDDISKEINRLLKEYTDGVGEEVAEIAEKVAKDAAKKLKATSPKQDVKGGGDYAKGWRAKKVGTEWVVPNATDYQLTHLLEKGHAKVGGGRVAPVVHIAPVEQQMINEYTNGVEEAIRG
mgnify:CR=1 FL=1